MIEFNEKIYLSQTEFARLRGISQPAVSKMISTGRIRAHFIKGKAWIEPDEANRSLGESFPPINLDQISVDLASHLESDWRRPLKEIKAERMYYEACMLELELGLKTGKYLTLEKVKAVLTTTSLTARNQFLDLPNRLASELASAASESEIRMLLTKEIEHIVSSAEQSLQQL